MEHRKGNDQESRATNKECKKTSTESDEKTESFSLDEESEEEVQSKETELPNVESNKYIDEEELSDEEDEELVDEELSEEKNEPINEEIADKEEEFGAEEISDEEESNDEEISGEEEDESKNLKNEEIMKNFKKKYQIVLAGPNPPPPIPPEFKNCIQENSRGQGISFTEEKEESIHEEISDEEEEELGAGEPSDEEEEKFSPEEISDEEEDESSDEEISGEEEDESKHLKNEEGMKNFKNKYQVVLAGPNPPPPIPPEFKNCIQEKSRWQGISFTDEILVIQKQLSETEIIQPRSRLFIPPDFIRNKHFNDHELDELNNNSFIPVTIIDPLIENVWVNLRRKLMIKNIGGEPSRAYVLNEDWDRIVTVKNLEEGDIVQLWAVRVGGNLCFVLVKLPKEEAESCGENTSISIGCDTHDSEPESSSSTENEDI